VRAERVIAALWAGCVFVGAVLSAPALSAATQNPTGDVRFTNIGPPPPVSSLRSLWLQSPVVIVGRVVSTSAPRVVGSIVSRVQTLSVSDVIKGTSPTLGGAGIVEVVMFGGTAILDGVEYRTNYPVAPMTAREEVLIFLMPRGTEYHVSGGAYGLFRIDADRGVIFNERQQSLTSWSGPGRRTIEHLIAELRAFR